MGKFCFKDSWFGSLSELIVEKMSKITFKWFVYQLFCSQERLLNAIVLVLEKLLFHEFKCEIFLTSFENYDVNDL